MRASVADVVLTIGLTGYLVVGRHAGARGPARRQLQRLVRRARGLWWIERRRLGGICCAARAHATRCGDARVRPADRPGGRQRLRAAGRRPLVSAARAVARRRPGLYALAAKLATVVFVAVRGFQYAWPPLAYSVEDDAVAARLYAVVTTYYVLATGRRRRGGRAARALGGAPAALPRLLGAHHALPWLALGWALYGLYLIFVVISGRARRTRRNLPAALAGLAVNVVGAVLLVPPLGIAGAGHRARARLRGDDHS